MKLVYRLLASIGHRALLVRIDETILAKPSLHDLVEQTHCRPGRHYLTCAHIGDLDEEIWPERSSRHRPMPFCLATASTRPALKARRYRLLPLRSELDDEGIAVLFRYGVVVLIGLSQQQEQELLEKLSARVSGRLDRYEEEIAVIRLADEDEDQVPAGGPIQVRAMSPERLLVISDVLAKSVVLAHDERRVAEVFEVIEPFARQLATRGKAHLNRTGILRLIGNALLVQHRVSGRVAITEKPDALWDRPDLERLYARLEDEYELQERVDTLNRKLAVIAETATTLADIIDTQRSLRLELIIVALIAVEIVITFYQILASRTGH